MNGIDAVVLATGNDFRAVEAGAHAYAALSGYKPLISWKKNSDGDLEGSIELPVAMGIVGGATSSNPKARIALKILGVATARELAEVVVAVGLAQNLGALRALVTEGIQRGHMSLHARNIAITAGAEGKMIDRVAEIMVAEGVLDNPKPDITLALHLWNEEEVRWLGIAPGPLMAAGEIFRVRVTGKGGHGALPNQTIDPVITTAQIISALQSIPSRNVSPLQSATISVGSIHGGEVFNVIPSEVEFHGTIRTFESSVRQVVLERFQQVVSGIAQSMGCEVEIDMQMLTPAVINDQKITTQVQRVAQSVLPDSYIEENYRAMVSEDMAFMMQDIPSCYFLIGSANPEKGIDASHHHPRFDIDEDVLPHAVALMAAATVSYLKS